MKTALKEYWNICMKPGLEWCKKHWKGYTVLLVVSFVLPFLIEYVWYHLDDITDIPTKIKERFSKEEES